MMDTRRNVSILGGSVLALSLALTGCATTDAASTPATPTASTPAASSSATPKARTAETVVRDYLAAIVAEDSAAAWALLTPEAQSFYGGDPEVYASWFGRDGVTSAEEATAFEEATFTETEGPEGAFTLVSARTDAAADAWIVRDAGSGPLLDDAGVPTTGPTLYDWRNPSSGAEDATDVGDFDPARPAEVFFASPESMDSDVPSTIGYPDVVWAYVDGEEVPAEYGPAADSGHLFTIAAEEVEPGAVPRSLTIVWQVAQDSTGWRSSTTLILP